MAKKVVFDENAIFSKGSDVQAIRTDEGIIFSRTSLKNETIYYLDNPICFKIWDLIDQGNSFKKIKEALLSEYDVNEKKMTQDLKKFIGKLFLKKLLTNPKNC